MNQVDIRIALQGQQAAAAGLKQVGVSFGELAASAGKAFVSFQLLKTVYRELESSYKAIVESNVAVAQLNQALASSGVYADAASEAFVKQAEALERLTGSSDESIIGVQRLLVTLGATTSEALKLTPLVLDLAANLGTDLTTAARMVGSALDGQNIQLGRLNIQANSTQDLVDKLTKSFGGQAAALKEAKGPGVDLHVALERIKESAGSIISVVVDFWLKQLAAAAFVAADAMEKLNLQMQKASQSRTWVANQTQVLALMMQQMAGLVTMEEYVRKMRDLQGATQDILVGNSNKSAVQNMPQVQATANSGPYVLGPDALPYYQQRQTTLDLALKAREVQLQRLEGALGSKAFEAQLGAMQNELRILEKKKEVLNESAKLMDLNDYQAQRLAIDSKVIQVTQEMQRLKLQNFEAVKKTSLEVSVSANITNSIDELVLKIGSAAQQIGRAFSSIAENSISAISEGLTGLINGTMTWGQALDHIRNGIANGIISAITRMFAEWLVGRTMMFVKEVAFSSQEAVVKAPSALMTSISSYGVAAAVGIAALLAAMAALGAFAGGGYTGHGGKNEPAGVVHRGEVVWSQNDVAAWGGAGAVDRMRVTRRAPGYATGGIVGGAGSGPEMIPMQPITIIVDDRQSALEKIKEHQGRAAITVISAATGARLDMGLNT